MERDIVAAILKELNARKGFSWWYDPVDDETKREIERALEVAVSPMVEAFTERLANAEAAMLLYFDILENGDYVSTGIAKYLQGRKLIDSKCLLTPKGETVLEYVKAKGLPKLDDAPAEADAPGRLAGLRGKVAEALNILAGFRGGVYRTEDEGRAALDRCFAKLRKAYFASEVK